ncbi:MAG: alpha/beta hydrolase [Gammaproteobacteria bacterium]|nr:alpha/beta hydrolase [Gammaproteobacteria bacterium]
MKNLQYLFTFVFLIFSNLGVAFAGDRVGVVLLHGMGTQPQYSKNSTLASNLRSQGYDVVAPVFPWSGRKGKTEYNGSLQDAYNLISEKISDLKSQGNKHIFLAGHSIGAVVSFGYASEHSNIDGVIGITPGFPGWSSPSPINDSLDFKPKILENMSNRAHKRIDMGKGDEGFEFVTKNHGKKFKIWTTPNNYLSFHHLEGVSRMDIVIPKLNSPVIWISTSEDVFTENGLSEEAYDLAPTNKMNKYVEISTWHNDAPANSGEYVISWINKVIGN